MSSRCIVLLVRRDTGSRTTAPRGGKVGNMKVKTYKNGNVTVRRETEDAPRDIAAFAEWLCKSLPEFEGEVKDVYAYVAYIVLSVNGTKWVYPVTEDVVDVYNNGKTCRLVAEDKAPLFTLPSYYDYREVLWNGRKGVIYTFCDSIPEGTRTEMKAAGCVLLRSQSEYAPEIRHAAAFVPYGTPFSYC